MPTKFRKNSRVSFTSSRTHDSHIEGGLRARKAEDAGAEGDAASCKSESHANKSFRQVREKNCRLISRVILLVFRFAFFSFVSSRPAELIACSCRMALAFGALRRVGGFMASKKPLFNQVPVRFLNLHEYQSKELMAKHGVRVQKGLVATNEKEALEAAEVLVKEGAEELVVKAQIHAGGRGKGHFNTGFKKGVHIRSGPNRAKEIAESAKQMFGNNLITKQTGPEGQKVMKVLIHEGINFDREMYFAILMDRAYNGPVMVASTQGGMDIEEVAHSNPDAIFTQPIDVEKGVQPADTEKVARMLGFKGEELVDVQEQMAALYNLFITCDATQVEINPLVVTRKGKVYCVDAKITFDDNAEFRQKLIYAMRDTSMEDPREVEASKFNLNYIGLDGNIGCMVNGAGLAMATMDIIQLYGGKPANFLDVGTVAFFHLSSF